jgi:ABC-type nitrate/sulfonate/bicarbonate transport system permease component
MSSPPDAPVEAVEEQLEGRDPRRSRGANRHSRAKRWESTGYGLLGLVVTLAVLQGVSYTGLVSRRDIPPVSQILTTLGHQIGTTALWHLLGQTLEQAGAGLGLAILVAVPVGIAIGSYELLWRAVRPTVEFLRPVPSVALIPLAILLYGNGVKSTVLLAAFAAVWGVLIHVIYGMRDIDEVALNTMRSFRLGWPDRLRFLILPSTLPFLATGIRLGATGALIVAITTELAIGSPGLGNAIITAENADNIRLMYAFIVVTGLLGVAVHVALSRCEASLLRWHPSHRAADAS